MNSSIRFMPRVLEINLIGLHKTLHLKRNLAGIQTLKILNLVEARVGLLLTLMATVNQLTPESTIIW